MVRTFQHRLIVSPGSFSCLFLHKVIKAESFYHDLIRFHDHNEPGWTRDGAGAADQSCVGGCAVCSVQQAACLVSEITHPKIRLLQTLRPLEITNTVLETPD